MVYVNMLHFSLFISSVGILYVFPKTLPRIIESYNYTKHTVSSLESVEDVALETDEIRYHRETEDNCNLKKNYFLVDLRENNNSINYCSGSVIAPRWILTTAGCFKWKFLPDEVVLGIPVLNKTSKGFVVTKYLQQSRNIQKYFIHSEFNISKMLNDIALVLLENEVDTLEIADFATITDKLLQDDLSKECDPNSFTLLYWAGNRGASHQHPYRLCQTDPYVVNETCSNLNIICTTGSSKCDNIGFCTELYGSPLFCGGYQYGVMVYSRNEKLKYYTRIDRHLEFIKNTMKNKMTSGKKSLQLCSYLSMSLITPVLIQILK